MRHKRVREFILDPRDWKHRSDCDARVGERIIEQGTHEELLRRGSYYAKLRRQQSGGFLPDDVAEERVE